MDKLERLRKFFVQQNQFTVYSRERIIEIIDKLMSDVQGDIG